MTEDFGLGLNILILAIQFGHVQEYLTLNHLTRNHQSLYFHPTPNKPVHQFFPTQSRHSYSN